MKNIFLIYNIVIRSCFIFFLSFLFSQLTAQQIKSEYDIGWDGNRIQLHSITNKAQQQVCNVLLSEDSMIVFILNDSVIKDLAIIELTWHEKFLGGFFKNNKIYLYLKNDEDAGLHTWMIDATTGAATDNIVAFHIKKEKTLDRMSCGDHFCVLYY